MIRNLIDAKATAQEWRALGLGGVSEARYLEWMSRQTSPIDTIRLFRLYELRGDEQGLDEIRSMLTRDELAALTLRDAL